MRPLCPGGPALGLLLLMSPLTCARRGVPNDAALADDRAAERQRLVRDLQRGGIGDAKVLGALGTVPRHRFVPAPHAAAAYEDTALPLSHGQTISQPYVVAHMTELLDLDRRHRVLEIGTGSGYQAAVLAELAGEVYTIEIVPELAAGAARTLAALGYRNVHVRAGDGYRGWPERAPFDRILLTAAPEEVPEALTGQLAPGGRLVAPVGGHAQEIVVLDKTEAGLTRRSTIPVRFVPMVRSHP